MAEVSMIAIDNKPPGTFRLALRHGVIWGYLIAAETAAHYLFGGSWVIDIMILAALCLLVTAHATRRAGMAVRMTPNEIRQWVAAGMPNDIKEWRSLRKIAEAA